MASSPGIATLSINDFEPHLNAVFEMRSPGGIVPLKLDNTGSCGQAIRKGGAFSRLFVAPAGPFLPQAIYPLQHPALGTLELFLVPVGPVPGGNGYHAVFT
ncbi:hypothetical protein [Bradyrhizobium sp.]|uniref:DUF6916 family protein n=1 Tax=Bradyrhizobium sp. TaxID=376 RepID=UPI002733D71A|nr:hypothetical protein [Bradyrhizobium sp.]MDP3689941.1 hypothetical protein [Bradyrhizobium sp.]